MNSEGSLGCDVEKEDERAGKGGEMEEGKGRRRKEGGQLGLVRSTTSSSSVAFRGTHRAELVGPDMLRRAERWMLNEKGRL